MEENSPPYVQVPPDRLPAEVYQLVLEEFINREGTDYGAMEMSLTAKLLNLRKQVDRGEVVILFDFESSSCTLMARQAADLLIVSGTTRHD
jgi:uncharacterized protein YheU (UPF0270 family)